MQASKLHVGPTRQVCWLGRQPARSHIQFMQQSRLNDLYPSLGLQPLHQTLALSISQEAPLHQQPSPCSIDPRVAHVPRHGDIVVQAVTIQHCGVVS